MKAALAALLLVVSLALSGCAGYRLGSAVPQRMSGVHSLAVPAFRNDTLEPHLEALAAGTVIAELQRDGTFAVLPADEADAVLEGTIRKITRRGARSMRADIVQQQEYSLLVTFAYKVTRRDTGAQLDAGEVVGETSFFISGNDINQDERQALPLAIEKAAQRLVSKISTGW